MKSLTFVFLLTLTTVYKIVGQSVPQEEKNCIVLNNFLKDVIHYTAETFFLFGYDDSGLLYTPDSLVVVTNQFFDYFTACEIQHTENYYKNTKIYLKFKVHFEHKEIVKKLSLKELRSNTTYFLIKSISTNNDFIKVSFKLMGTNIEGIFVYKQINNKLILESYTINQGS